MRGWHHEVLAPLSSLLTSWPLRGAGRAAGLASRGAGCRGCGEAGRASAGALSGCCGGVPPVPVDGERIALTPPTPDPPVVPGCPCSHIHAVPHPWSLCSTPL